MGGQRDVSDAPLFTQYGFEESLTSLEGLGHASFRSSTLRWQRAKEILARFRFARPRPHSLGKPRQGHRSNHRRAIRLYRQSSIANRPVLREPVARRRSLAILPPKARRGDESKRELYLGVLKALDDQLTPIFDRIRNDSKLRDNTLIIVCSDNGPEDGAGSAGPFRGLKGMLYEGGIRSH